MFREAWLISRERPLHRTRSARSSAPLPRSRSDTRGLLLSLSLLGYLLRGPPLDRSPLVLPNTIQAGLGDAVVLVPPSVSRARGPLDSTLVLQILDGIVVAEAVRIDAGALSRRLQGQVGSWRERLRSVVLWAISSVGFSFYLANFADYGVT